jgi:hypothetical protein
MTLSAFADPARPPVPEELDATLGTAAPYWAQVVADVRDLAGDIDQTWNHAGARYGWSMRLARRGRNLVYLTPQHGCVLVGVVLGEKAIAAADAAGFVSDRTRGIVQAAPRYAEGRGIRLEVTGDEDLAVARELARIKLGR